VGSWHEHMDRLVHPVRLNLLAFRYSSVERHKCPTAKQHSPVSILEQHYT